MTLAACAQLLGDALGTPVKIGATNHADVLSWAIDAQKAGLAPAVVVIDGLDEATDEGERIATELLKPLAGWARVIVASRDRPAHPAHGDDVQTGAGTVQHTRAEGAGTLLGLLGSPTLRIDLGADPEGTDADIERYVRARIADAGHVDDPDKLVDSAPAAASDHEHPDAPATMDPDAVARAVAALVRTAGGQQREGGFLLARVLTSQLRARPVDTTVAAWEAQLATSIEGALRQDIECARPRERGGEVMPGATADLLTALACSYGQGFPADDVWPAVASALSGGRCRYDRLDAFWVLDEQRRYVTASSLDGQAVYRLHHRLGETLRNARDPVIDQLARTVAFAVLDVYESFLEAGQQASSHPYLWHLAWLHVVDGETPAIDAFERLAQHHPTLWPAVATALHMLGIRYGQTGRDIEAVTPTERAVSLRETLAESGDPAHISDLAASLTNLGGDYCAVGRPADSIAPSERAVTLCEELVLESPTHRKQLVDSLYNLGARYHEVERPSDAVTAFERAVQHSELLTAENPGYLGDLAQALRSLSTEYGEVGRPADSIAPGERAIAHYETLAAADTIYVSSLANALVNLGASLSELGRTADSIPITTRALELYEALAADDPSLTEGLAHALKNLGRAYSVVGRHADALDPAERAVELFQSLADADSVRPLDLAKALFNLGAARGAVGRPADAAVVTERAAELYAMVAADNRDAMGGLVNSLSALSQLYREAGRDLDSIEPAERAAELCAGQAAEDPARRATLAHHLTRLVLGYIAVGRITDAVAPAERAVGLYATLAETDTAHLGSLSGALTDLGGIYAALGRFGDAVAPAERAVQVNATRVTDDPACLGDLARSFNTLSIVYIESGRPADAAILAEQSAEAYAALAAEDPVHLRELGNALTFLANTYLKLGRPEEAVTPAKRGVEIAEGLSADDHTRSLGLAMSLLVLGAAYSAVERPADAIAPTERAVELEEVLAARYPARRDGLARALNNLGTLYIAVERYADAVAPVERAVELFELLAVSNDSTGLADVRMLARALNDLAMLYREAGRPDDGAVRWSATLSRLANDMAASVDLRLHRANAEDDLHAAVATLIEAYEINQSLGDPEVEHRFRVAARLLRGRDPERFDVHWTPRAGARPDWLMLDENSLIAAATWFDAPTWADSKARLADNPELLTANGDIALGELPIAARGHPLITRHHEVLAAIREYGIDVAYRPLLILDTVNAWLALDNLAASERFLTDNLSDLTSPEAAQNLAARRKMLHQALVVFASAGEPAQGYMLLRAPEQTPAALAIARQGEPRLLGASAQLALITAQTTTDKAFAAIHLAIALTTIGDGDSALALARQLSAGALDTNPLVNAVSDAIARNPEHASGLAALINRLTSA